MLVIVGVTLAVYVTGFKLVLVVPIRIYGVQDVEVLTSF